LQPGAYVDSKLRHQESDLLFAVPFKGQPLLLYLLFEHQRTVETWMVLRLLGYMVQIWQDLLKHDPNLTRLPPIVPLVLYQGPKGWNVPVRFMDRLDMPEDLAKQLGRYQPAFEHLLVDLSLERAEELRGDLIGRLGLSLLKAVAEEKQLAWLEQAGPLFAEILRQEQAPGIVETLLRYLMAADSDLDFETVRRAMEQGHSRETQDQVMSIAEELMEKGRQEGRSEGVQAGALIGQIQTLQDLLNLPQSRVDELAVKSAEELQRLAHELRRSLSK